MIENSRGDRDNTYLFYQHNAFPGLIFSKETSLKSDHKQVLFFNFATLTYTTNITYQGIQCMLQ